VFLDAPAPLVEFHGSRRRGQIRHGRFRALVSSDQPGLSR
jgi:hypothetical protein